MAKTSQKILLFCLVALVVLLALSHATAAADQNSASTTLDDIPDSELDIDDDEDDFPADDEQDVPDQDAFDPDNLTPEQLEQLKQYQQQMQQQQQEIFSSPDVEPTWVLPASNNVLRKLPLGEESQLVLGFTNTGSDNFQVLGVRGAIVDPRDYTFVIQNLTGIRYNSTVQPEETNSLSYKFVPDSRLEVDPKEYGMMVMVYYMNDDNTTFATTFFNETVTFHEVSTGVIDFQQIFMFLMLLSIGAFAVYLTMQYMKGSSKKGSRSSSSSTPSASTPTNSKEVDFSHLPPRLRKRFKNASPSPASPKSS